MVLIVLSSVAVISRIYSGDLTTSE